MNRRAIIAVSAAAVALSGAAVVPAAKKDEPMPEPDDEPKRERVPPNRLAVDPASDYYDAEAIKGLTVYVNGRKMPGNVVEYDIARGKARCYLKDGRGNPRRERGKLSTYILTGVIEAKYE